MRNKLLVLSLGLILIAAACNKTSTTDETQNSSDNTQAVTPTPTPTPTPTQTPTPTPNPSPAPVPTPATATVHITSTGFSPASITVKKGTKITFVNDDTKNHWPASDPHPTHTDYPGFDPKTAITAGSSWSFTFTKVGTWGYHDHLNSSRGGTIIVTE